MKILLKAVLIGLIIILGIFLTWPYFSILLPHKVAQRTYQRLLCRVIAEEAIRECKTPEERALGIFNYVVDHEFIQGDPEDGKPVDALIRAQAYCDFQARSFNALASTVGLPSRYVVLYDKDGVSPHTFNEVNLGGRWVIFDTTLNLIFKDSSGRMLTLEELSQNPELIFNQQKIMFLKEFKSASYEDIVVWINRMFPLPQLPERSKIASAQNYPIDYLGDFYLKLFGKFFFSPYQDAYLKLKPPADMNREERFFMLARNYHLALRYDKARRYYQKLQAAFPQGRYSEDAFFFSAMLSFEEGDLTGSEKLFVELVKKSPKWREAGYYYLGRIYMLRGKEDMSLEAYMHTSIYKLSGTILKKINHYKKS